MGMFIKLFGLALAVGAGYAAVKVAKKYDENRQNEIMSEDYDPSEKKCFCDGVKTAMKDVYCETSQKVKTSVKNTANNIGIDTDEFGAAFVNAGAAAAGVGKVVADAGVKVYEKVKVETPGMIDGAKEIAGSAASQVKSAVDKVGEKFSKKDDCGCGADCDCYMDEDYEVTEEETVSPETEITDEEEYL